MARKIAIIGLGHVGAAIAHGLVTTNGADELIFIDTNSAKAEAEALDFQDAAANLKYDVHIVVNDWQALNDADIVISTLGQISLQKTGQATGDRFVELQFTKQQVRGVADKIVASGFHGVLVVVTNPVDVITALYQRFTGFPANRVIGSGTLLDTARMQRAVGVALGVNPKSVSGYNLGEHGNSQFTAWSTVRVHGELVGDDADLIWMPWKMKPAVVGTPFMRVRNLPVTALQVPRSIWLKRCSQTHMKSCRFQPIKRIWKRTCLTPVVGTCWGIT